MLKRTTPEVRENVSGELPDIEALLSSQDDSVILSFDPPVSYTDARRIAYNRGLSGAKYILKSSWS